MVVCLQALLFVFSIFTCLPCLHFRGNLICFLVSLFSFSFFAVGAAAQDITISGPVILRDDSSDAIQLDTLPALKSTWDVSPDEKLRQLDESAHAFIVLYVDEKGVPLKPQFIGGGGGNNYLAYLVQGSWTQPTFHPAKLNGNPVGASIRFTAIFNPASASEKNEDAIPRVLAVAPVPVTLQQYKDLRAAKQSLVIVAGLRIDESGAVTGCTFSKETRKHAEDFKAEVDAALALWKFAPARAAGKPIASNLSIRLLLRPPEYDPAPEARPQPVKRPPPVYPFAMKKSGVSGVVTVQFIVNKKGDVENPIVVRSSHKGFEDAAIDAVRKWKFKPATKNGKPVAARMQIPINFNLNR